MKEQKNRAPAAAAAIKIIECIAQAAEPLSISGISSCTDINKNMISRTLSELLEAGWVSLDEKTGGYSLTLQLFQLSSSALKKKTLTSCSGSYLKRLSELTGECIQLAVKNGDSVVYIDQIESKNIAGIKGQIGASYPLDNTAPGKVFRAFEMNDADLSELRSLGYACDNEEYGRGVICIAAPVYDYTGNVVAALNIASLTVNHSMEEMVGEFSSLLIEQAAELSEELGYMR